ncbi:MAG: putative baseplate assembly protein [Planctomycetota bacterium]
MTLPTPNLDDRTFEQIRDEAIRLIPQYCPEWTNYNPSDPGITLIELFAWMTEMVLYRLNRVPDKVYLTLLDLIGIRLRPPQPSRTMLTFHLVDGFAGGTWVPRGTQIATEPNEDGDSIVFETEHDLYAVSTRLREVISIHRDKVAEHTEQMRALPREPFDAFAGTKEIDRYLYLADARFATLAESGTVQVVFECPQARTEGLTALLEWEYWNGHRWRDLDTVEIPPEEDAATGNQKSVGFAGPLEDIAPGGVEDDDEEERFWIRGHLIELPAAPAETVVGSITAAAQIMEQGIGPEQALAAVAGVNVPQDTTKTFFPFSETPVTDAAFYVQSEEVLGKEDARVFLDLIVADQTLVPAAKPTRNLILAFEYFNGTRWVELGRTTPEGAPETVEHDFRDSTNAFTQSGTVSFLRPQEMALHEVNGVEGHWVRARIAQGDYGRAGGYQVVDGNWVWKDDHPLAPPGFRSLELRYSQVPYPVDRCLTYNDFTYVDRTHVVRDEFKSFQAFEPFREENPALYLGFDAPFPEQPVRLYIRLEEFEESEHDVVLNEPFPEEASEREKRRRTRKPDQRLSWEYWDGAKWADLKPRDETQNLTRSGTLEFRGPGDLVARPEFGRDLYWVRCRLEMGSYARSPKVVDILVNTVSGVHATEVRGEVLGHSDGTPDQRFTFSRFPVLPGPAILVREHEMPGQRELRRLLAEEGQDALKVQLDDGGNPVEIWTRWHRVESFYASQSTDRHYVLDPVVGRVIFGDGRRGRIPTPGPNAVVAERYQTGGGLVGNVGAGSLVVLRQSVPYVDRVSNYYKARGGADLETIGEAKLRGPQVVRHRYRAVTIEDYEWLALKASPNVARARCLKTPRREGEVTIIVLPEGEQQGRDLRKKPMPAPELLRRVHDFLDERRLVTTKLRVIKPRFVEISVNLAIVLKQGQGGPGSERLKSRLEDSIRGMLHPLFGGLDGKGWPFGRAVHKSDLYRVAEGHEGVDYVEDLELYDEDLKRSVVQVPLREDELVHVVNVTVKEIQKEILA